MEKQSQNPMEVEPIPPLDGAHRHTYRTFYAVSLLSGLFPALLKTGQIAATSAHSFSLFLPLNLYGHKHT